MVAILYIVNGEIVIKKNEGNGMEDMMVNNKDVSDYTCRDDGTINEKLGYFPQLEKMSLLLTDEKALKKTAEGLVKHLESVEGIVYL